MPIYNFYMSDEKAEWKRDHAQKVIQLHSFFFKTPPELVRVYFHNLGHDGKHAWGGYNMARDSMAPRLPQAANSTQKLINPYISEYCVVMLNFNGTPDVWEEYCRRLRMAMGRVRDPGRPNTHAILRLGSVYLQRIDHEFEGGETRSSWDPEPVRLPLPPVRSLPDDDLPPDEAPPAYSGREEI